jgi:hypothetical protein
MIHIAIASIARHTAMVVDSTSIKPHAKYYGNCGVGKKIL